MTRLVAVLLVLGASSAAAEEDRGTEALGDVQGVVLYARKGRIKKVTLGEREAQDLGEGECARFSPDGKRIAVFHDGRIHVMDADGRNRRQILDGADWPEDGCAVEFHANGKEIVYVKERDGLWTVRITDGRTARMDLPGRYTGEVSMSADGKRLTARWGHDLYAVDVVAKTHRKFAKGCSPGVSPDGKRLMNNTGGHHEMIIRGWDGQGEERVNGRAARPDGSWDDFHWSNHPDYIVAAGDRKKQESYVLRVSDRQIARVTWEEKTRFPDLFVTRVGRAKAPGPRPSTSPAVTARPTPVPLGSGSWPVVHDGLVYLWEDAQKPNEIRTEDGRLRTCRAEPRDAATFSSRFGMDLTGGAFVPEDVDERLLATWRARGELAVEAVVTPRPGSGGRIVSFGEAFVLGQEGGKGRRALRLTLRTSARATELILPPLLDGTATHVLVTSRPGLLVVYANGVEVHRPADLAGDLRSLAPARLIFGATERDDRAWSGTLEAVALYARFIDAPEVAQKAVALATRLGPRPEPPRTVVRARVTRLSTIPDPRDIEPYRRALVVGRYQMVDGPGPRRELQVARWSILDGRVVASAARAKVGDEVSLVLEPFEAHPELESERLVNDAESVDEPVFLDVTPLDRLALTAARRGR